MSNILAPIFLEENGRIQISWTFVSDNLINDSAAMVLW